MALLEKLTSDAWKAAVPLIALLTSLASLGASILALVVSGSILFNQTQQFAWGRISSHMPGNSGVGPALELLSGRGAVLERIDLSPISIANAQGADLATPSLVNKVFAHDVVLSDVDLTGARLDDTDFTGGEFIDTNFTMAVGFGTVFARADMSKSKLIDATLENADFTLTNLSSADLTRLRSNNITANGANFTGAILDHADLNEMTGFGASFKGAQLPGAILTDGVFWAASFEDANFKFARLHAAEFHNAHLSGADFTMARGFTNATFENVWAWENKVPKIPVTIGTTVPENWQITLYSEECVDAWTARVAEELQEFVDGGHINIVKGLFRPPDDEGCKSQR